MGGNKITVLLVEDNEADAKLVQRTLRQVREQFFDVTTVDHLEMALIQLKQSKYDVILLDLGLPDSRGISTFSRLHERSPNIPIIIFTIAGDESMALSAISLGAQDYLVKGTSDARMMAKSIIYAIERKRLELKLEQKAKDLAAKMIEAQRAKESLAQLAAIVEQSDEAIFRKTLDGIITTWNAGAKKMYGYSEEEIIGKPVSILMPPGRKDEMPEILEKIKTGESVRNLETVRMKKDGTLIYVLLTVSPVKDLNGRIIGASTIARDITELLQAREAVIKSKE